MISRIGPMLLALPLLACGAAMPQRDPSAPKAGLWEVTTIIETYSDSRMSAAQQAEFQRNLPPPDKAQQCSTGRIPVVGGKSTDGTCTFTRVADSGPNVDRSMTCIVPGEAFTATLEFKGTRSATRYELLTTSEMHGPEESSARVRMVGRESGKWIGACEPAKP